MFASHLYVFFGEMLRSFPHFLIGLFVFLVLSCVSCFYILEINPLSVVSFAVQFSSVAQSCLTLCDPMYCSLKAPPSMEFSRQEYWSGLPFPSPGSLPDPRTKPGSPALAGGFFATEPPGKPPL